MIETQIIEFLRENGPSTPAQFAKYASITLLFASAMLGDVASKGLAKTSHLKIGGGSPLYYLEESKEKLQNFSSRLGSKDRQIYEEILNKKVIRESELNPLARLSLRNIKDFAVPIRVKISGVEEVFWRWYLLEQKEAERVIRELVARKDTEKNEETNNLLDETRNNVIEDRSNTESKNKIADTLKKLNVPDKTKKEILNEPPLEKTKESSEEIKDTSKITKKIEEVKIVKNELKEKIFEPENFIDRGDLSTELFLKFTTINAKKILSVFKEKDIIVLKYEVVKKNKEYNLLVSVSSSIGKIKCYAKIIDKKKITDGDIALFIVEAQNKGLPGVLIAPKDGLKKLEEKIGKDFKAVNFLTF